jgi:hypothetical protein
MIVAHKVVAKHPSKASNAPLAISRINLQAVASQTTNKIAKPVNQRQICLKQQDIKRNHNSQFMLPI